MTTMTADQVKQAIKNATSPDAKAEAVETMLWDFCRSPENVIYCFVMADVAGSPLRLSLCRL